MGAMASESAAHCREERDLEYVDAVVRRSRTSFYWALRLLPEHKRRAMFAIYAFCRQVDDVADEPGAPGVKRAMLQSWREDIGRLYAGNPEKPVCRALLSAVSRFALRRRDFEAIIDGMEMDAADTVRIADRDELRLYCDRVACAVGRLSGRVFGADEATGDRLAAALGEALQLTNILRDLDEDAGRDRLYLPADLLRAQGVGNHEDAAAVLADPRTAAVCAQLAETAGEQFAAAARILAGCDARKMRPALIMMEVYRRTLGRLTARGWQRRTDPVSLSPLEKLWVALRYGVM